MTTVFQRDVAGPATHAFVIGVSSYPCAAAGPKVVLQNVPEIASADASAMLVADWLYRNRDNLAQPLGSLEVLLGGAQPANGHQYQWQDLLVGGPIDTPTTVNVVAAGTSWHQRLEADAGSIAFFYVCGHGAAKKADHVVFLTDLNGNAVDPWAHINVARLASAFKQQANVRAAVFFVDACKEFVVEFEAADESVGAKFMPAFDSFQPGHEKVALLSAASHALLAYEGDWKEDSQIKIGRFTETLVAAFCSCVREKRGPAGLKWMVHSSSIMEDLKHLHRARRKDWRSEPFEPSLGLAPNEVIPIVTVENPDVPVVVLTDPEDKMSNCDLEILNQAGSCDLREAGPADEWITTVPASIAEHVVEARLQGQVYKGVFVPRAPIFDAWVSLK